MNLESEMNKEAGKAKARADDIPVPPWPFAYTGFQERLLRSARAQWAKAAVSELLTRMLSAEAEVKVLREAPPDVTTNGTGHPHADPSAYGIVRAIFPDLELEPDEDPIEAAREAVAEVREILVLLERIEAVMGGEAVYPFDAPVVLAIRALQSGAMEGAVAAFPPPALPAVVFNGVAVCPVCEGEKVIGEMPCIVCQQHGEVRMVPTQESPAPLAAP